jgi:hypothetical protein
MAGVVLLCGLGLAGFAVTLHPLSLLLLGVLPLRHRHAPQAVVLAQSALLAYLGQSKALLPYLLISNLALPPLLFCCYGTESRVQLALAAQMLALRVYLQWTIKRKEDALQGQLDSALRMGLTEEAVLLA